MAKKKLSLENVITKQLELLQGISVEDLSHRSFLSYGQLLVKEYKRSLGFLKDPSIFIEDSHYEHWRVLKDMLAQNIEEVMHEANNRMIPGFDEDEEALTGALLIRYLSILSDIKACLQEEKLNQVSETEQSKVLPDKNIEAVKKVIKQYQLF